MAFTRLDIILMMILIVGIHKLFLDIVEKQATIKTRKRDNGEC